MIIFKEKIHKELQIPSLTTIDILLNNKEHIEFFNKRTIFFDLVDKLERFKLVEPLDLRMTANTLDKYINYPQAVYRDTAHDDDFKKTHPLILVRVNDILVTSVMLVFQKH